MDVSQYLQIFIEESQDNLQTLNEKLLNLESHPADVETLNAIFRVAHTLKGMAGTMGFVKMQKITHSIENVLSEIRSGNIKVDSNLVDILFQGLDALENYVEQITTSGNEGDEEYKELVDLLTQYTSNEAIKVQTLLPSEQQPTTPLEKSIGSYEHIIELPEAQKSVKDNALSTGMNVFQINIRLAAHCVLKAARAFVIFNEVEVLGEVIYCMPQTQDIEDEKFDTDFCIILVTKESKEKIKQVLLNISEVEQVTVLEFTRENNEDKKTFIENIHTSSNEPLGETPKHISKTACKTVRVSIERLDTLMNLVSELIIVKTQLEELNTMQKSGENRYAESVEYLERITTSLNDAVMKVRMVPVETVFNRFPRMIRDTAKKLNKEIQLIMSGEETELDRTVIDEIGEPLIHMLRNAADHGLETTEQRIAAGKPKMGTIKLQAFQDGNSVVIEVIDDGSGIDVEKIKHKAIEKKVLTQEEIFRMTDKQITELLFKPSFSTSEAVSEISGRGVGLDVVKNKIAKLGGHVEVESELGKGSKFSIRLPLTLAIIQALMISIGEEKYAIPLNSIQSIEEVQRSDIKFIQKNPVIMVRNQVIPIIQLRDELNMPPEQEKEVMLGVIIKKGDKQVSLIVDSLIGQQEIVIKSLGKYLSGIDIIAGATILGNGEVALILDVNTLI